MNSFAWRNAYISAWQLLYKLSRHQTAYIYITGSVKHSCGEVYFSSCCCCAVLFVCVCERSMQRRNYPFYNAPRVHYCRDRVTKPKDFHWAAVGTHSNRHWSTARASTLSAIKRLNRSPALCCINTCISTHLYVSQSIYVHCQLCTSSPPSSVSKQTRLTYTPLTNEIVVIMPLQTLHFRTHILK